MAVSRDFLAIFYESNPHGPLLNRLTWFGWKIRFRRECLENRRGGSGNFVSSHPGSGSGRAPRRGRGSGRWSDRGARFSHSNSPYGGGGRSGGGHEGRRRRRRGRRWPRRPLQSRRLAVVWQWIAAKKSGALHDKQCEPHPNLNIPFKLLNSYSSFCFTLKIWYAKPETQNIQKGSLRCHEMFYYYLLC